MPLDLAAGLFRPSPDVPLWHDVDLTGLTLLLADEELRFARLALVDEAQRRGTPPPASRLRETTYVSRWHQHSTESIAMWERYAARGALTALRTSLGRVTDALARTDTTVGAGRVAYRDFALTGQPVDRESFEGLVLHRRPAYEPEREVRLYVTNEGRPRDLLGVRLDVVDLVEAIVVSPLADESTLRATRAIAVKFQPKVPVRPSTLLDPP